MQEYCQVQNHSDQLLIGICQNEYCKQDSRKVCKLCTEFHQQDPGFKPSNVRQDDQINDMILQFKQNIHERIQNISKQCQIQQYLLLEGMDMFMDFWYGKYQQWDYVEQTLQQIKVQYQDLNLDSYLNYQERKITLEQYFSQSLYESFNEIDQILNGQYYNHIPQKELALKSIFKITSEISNDRNIIQFLIDEQKIEQNIPNIYEKFTFFMGSEDNKQIIQRINQIQTFDIITQDRYDQIQICRKGQFLKNIGRIDESLKYFNQLIQLCPSNTCAYSFKAQILQDQCKFDKVLECWDECIKVNPNYIEAYEQKATILKSSDYKAAIECWDQCIKANPNNGDAYKLKAQFLQDKDEAIKCLDQCIKVNPNYLSAYEMKANLLQKQNNHQEAIECWTKCIRYNQYYGFAYQQKSSLLASQENYKEAIECLDLCLKFNSNYTNACEYKAQFLLDIGKEQEAIYCWGQFIKVNPENSDPYKYKARILQEQGNYDQSLECWNIYLRMNPHDGYAYEDKTKILLKQKNFVEAIECLNLCIKSTPDHSKAYYLKAKILKEQKNYKGAIESFELYLKLNPTSFLFDDIKSDIVSLHKLLEKRQIDDVQIDDKE